MSLLRWQQLRDAFVLTRPAQWPILSAQLAVGMALAWPVTQAGSVTQAGPVTQMNWPLLAIAWLVWVVMLNGGTLAFNSAYDQDTGPIAHLVAPPQPPYWLAAGSLLMMNLGALLGYLFVATAFGLVTSACVVLSVMYSHPAVRLKAKPGWDLMVNIFGYGAGTTLAGISAMTGQAPHGGQWWFVAGFGLLFGSFYPLSQIYQTEADRARGDRTLTTALGVRRSLILSIILGLLGGTAIWRGCALAGKISPDLWPWLLVLSLSVWCLHLVWWWWQAEVWSPARHERSMYRALGIWAAIDASLTAVWLLG